MSRRAAIRAAVGLALLLVAFGVIALVTKEPGWFLWSVVPILAVLGFFVAAVRGETLGEQKRRRDEQIAERKAAERKAKIAARSADK